MARQQQFLQLRTGIPILVGQEVIRFEPGNIPGPGVEVHLPIAMVIDIAPLNRQVEVELKGSKEHQTWPMSEVAVLVVVPGREFL